MVRLTAVFAVIGVAYFVTPSTSTALSRLRNRLSHVLTTGRRGGVGNPCDADTPFLCKSTKECVPLSLVCDGLPDCDDGFDENTHLCNAANRPAVGTIWKFLDREKSWILRPFFDGISPELIAHSIAVSSSFEELKTILGLSGRASHHLMTMFDAVKAEDERPLIELGMPENAWHETEFLLKKILKSGFQI